MSAVSILGLGLMGTAIAERLLAAGHDLNVYNRSAAKAKPLVERGAQLCTRPSELLQLSDVCLTVVSDDNALLQSTLGREGVIAGARPGTTLIDMSTVSVGASARVAAAASTHGVTYLRAPVSGNPSVVRAGRLAIIVSGPLASFDAVGPLLEQIGPSVYYVGDAEHARVVKLALNLMVAGTAALMAEAILLGERGGVDAATLLDVMSGSAVGSPFVKYKLDPLVRGDYSATFTTDMMRKDLALIRAQARRTHTQAELATRLQRLYDRASIAGWGDSDLLALLPWLRSQAGNGRARHATQETHAE